MMDNANKCYLMRTEPLLHIAEEIQPENGKTFELPELYRLLECDTIEVLRLEDPARWLIFDEEGKLKEKLVNLAATVVSGLYPHDVIVGNAIVCPYRFMD